MLERLKRSLVESFVGAIALGYLLAQCILHFANIFTSPLASWITRNEYRELISRTSSSQAFSFRDALPELVRFFFLSLVWYVLFRWLYYKPLKEGTSEPAANPEQAA